MAYINTGIALFKVGSALVQGQNDKMNANTQAMSLNYQADQEQEAAQQQAAIIRRAGQYATARETAAYAGAGVAVGSGSAAEVVDQTRTDATHDAYMTMLTGTKRANSLRANGKIAAVGGQVQANNAFASGVAGAIGSGMSGWSTSKGH